jgi:hypothetical protein
MPPSDDEFRKLAETCPVCGTLYLPAVMSSHVDGHLRTGKIVLQIGGNAPGLYIDGHKIRTAGER